MLSPGSGAAVLSPDRPPERGLETPAPLRPLGPRCPQDPAPSPAGAPQPREKAGTALGKAPGGDPA